ncbi:MAG TPA: M14 family zinc carboxypeptidase [Planctomycetota bacterium]|nr:M14 family zinc carboxypeptidase [Planctomycetota bacterium]
MPQPLALTWLVPILLTLTGGPLAAAQEPDEPPPPEPPQDLTAPPSGYLNADSLRDELLKLEKSYGRLELSRLRVTLDETPIYLATFRSPQFAATRPEALIIANLEGDRPVATEVAMAIIRDLATSGSPWDKVGTLHVIPVANPDAYARVMAGQLPTRGAPVDEDRDGRLDENGPSDVDGDGKILWLRAPTQAGHWYANPKDPRASEPVEGASPKPGAFQLRREGWDEDGDRRYVEDPPGGIQVDANFPHLWPQYEPKAGPYPLSEPESLILAQFLLSRKKLAWVLVLDDEDNLASPPKGVDKVDQYSRDPLQEDALFLKAWGERLYPKKAKDDSDEPDPRWTKPESGPQGAGNLADWAYFQLGLFTMESAIWTMPAEGGDADATTETKRLAWSDEHYKRGAFTPWKDFEHPEMGKVQIGGWSPLVLNNPPAEWLTDLGVRYMKFVDGLAADFARLEWTEVHVQPLDGEGVLEIRAKLANVGFLPTTSAMEAKTRSKLPIMVELRLPEGSRVLVGNARSQIQRLEGGGGAEDLRWIVQVPKGSAAPVLYAQCNTAGEATYTLE